MFERFTDRARHVVVTAQEEARILGHGYIGTEHLLLGLTHEATGLAARALEALGITEEAVRRQVEETTGRGRDRLTGRLPLTPQARKAIQLSLRETMRLGRKHIDTEHLLLGLIRDRDTSAAQVLVRLGADLTSVSGQVTALLPGYQAGDALAAALPARNTGDAGQAQPELLSELAGRLDAIESRLSDLDRRPHASLRSLSDDVGRLRELLRQHGIEPRDGAA